MNRKVLSALVVFLLIAWLSPSASATPVLDFGVVAPTTGSISYAGGANPLVGTNIQVDNVVGLETPLNDGVVLGITNGLLNFTSGNLTGFTATEWFFGGGASSTVTLTGGIAALGIPNGTVLLSGTFENATVTAFGGFFKIAGASFTDTKYDGLVLNYFNNLQPGWVGNFNLSFNAPGSNGSEFEHGLLSGDILNTPVPEPSSLFFLGAGLLALGGLAKLRRRS